MVKFVHELYRVFFCEYIETENEVRTRVREGGLLRTNHKEEGKNLRRLSNKYAIGLT